MDPQSFMAWGGGVALVISLGTSFYNFFTSGAKSNAKDIKSLTTTVIDHDRRIQTVEGELKHMPNKDDFNDLKITIVQLEGAVGKIDGQMDSMTRAVRRLEDFLRKGANE